MMNNSRSSVIKNNERERERGRTKGKLIFENLFPDFKIERRKKKAHVTRIHTHTHTLYVLTKE